MDVEFIRNKYEDGSEGFVLKKKFKIGVRHLQILYMIATSIVLGMCRGSIGITMQAVNDASRINDSYIEVHNWDRRTQATTFSSFFFGYAIMLVPAELVLSQRGSKMMVTALLAINGGLAAAMPNIINKGGWIAVCNTQFLLGISQAFLAPANRIMLDNWLPPNEKGVFSNIVYGATHLGMIIALPCAGALSTARLGWELICYTQAMAALSAGAVWMLLTAAEPRHHQAKRLPVPWRRILGSPPFWALACAHAASNAVFVFFLVDVPYYLQVHGTPLKDASIQATVPFIAMWFMYLATTPTVEWIHNSGFMSYMLNTTYYRKLINALGAFGTVIGLTVVSNLSPDTSLPTILLIGALGLIGFQFSGFVENHRSLSQNFSGTLLLMTSAFAAIISSGVPSSPVVSSATILPTTAAGAPPSSLWQALACCATYCTRHWHEANAPIGIESKEPSLDTRTMQIS
ncbi:putative inorganic phosphate cotransporter isoform X2 [Choristoneura fumiferana]|uniref:putative inorganic phosphate cotransporter isoform X2 n=1 Tax=Choristoneura fumiferana TaxID=7141 RepID=UPI003D15A9F0